MAIAHINRLDAVLHELGSYTYSCARALDQLDVEAHAEQDRLREQAGAFSQERAGRVQAEYERLVESEIMPAWSCADSCVRRIDAVDAYARSISAAYRKLREGRPPFAQACAGGGAPQTALRIEGVSVAADVLQEIAAEAESLRDQLVADCRFPRWLQSSELPRRLANMVDQGLDWYLGASSDEVVAYDRENLLAEAERRAGSDPTVEANERMAAVARNARARAQEVVRNAARGFAEVLAPHELDLLDELANLSLAGAPASETRDFVMLGWLAHEFLRGLREDGDAQAIPGMGELWRAFADCYGSRLGNGRLIVPLLMDRSENCSIAIAGMRDEVLPLFSSIAYAELEGTRAGCQRFAVIDWTGGGAGLGRALPFTRTLPQLVEGGVVTDHGRARELLARYAAQAREAAAANSGTALDLVERTGGAWAAHAPLTTVFVIDLPGTVDRELSDALVALASLGAAAGVNLVVSAVPCEEGAARYGEVDTLRSLPDACLVLNTPEKGFGAWTERFFPEEPAWDRLSGIQEALDAAEREAERAYRGLDRVLPERERGSGSAVEKLSVPFALAPDGGTVALEFGDAVADGLSHFALATGTTGTGKSSLLHAVVLSALLKYGPNELELYLLDFKQGVEFEIYRNYRLPQVRVVGLDADQAFGVSVLEALAAELERRARLYQELGVTSYAAARAAAREPLPRILVVLDEFQVLLNEAVDRRAAGRAATILRTLFQTARAFGVHAVLSTQALSSLTSGCSMGLNDFSQVNVRIGLRNSADEHRRLFGDAACDQARALMGSAKGGGVYLVDKDAAEPDLRAFRFCFVAKEERPALLRQVEELYAASPAPAPFVYRGGDVPALSLCPAFSAGAPTVESSANALRVYLGGPARMGAGCAVEVSRTRRSSVLCASADVEMADRMQAAYLACAVEGAGARMRSASGEPVAYVLDAHLLTGDGASPATEAVCRWAGRRVHVARTESEAVALLDELAGIVKKRRVPGSAAAAPLVHVLVGDPSFAEPLSAFTQGRDLALWRAAPADGRRAGTAGGGVVTTAGEAGFASHGPGDFDDLLARLDAMRSRLDNDGGSSSAARGPAKANVGAGERRKDAPRAGAGLMAELLDRGHMLGVNVCLASSDCLALKDLRYDVVAKTAWRAVHGLSDDQAHFIVPDVNPAALRRNTAVLWDCAHPPVAFKPFRIDAENLPPLP